jgi:hypothetical protein
VSEDYAPEPIKRLPVKAAHDPENCPDKSQRIVCNAEIESFIGVWSETRKLVPAIPSHRSPNSAGQSVKMEGLCTIIHRVVCLLSSRASCPAGDQCMIDSRMSLVCTTYAITASGSAVTRVCHCVLIWVRNISQNGRDEQGENKRFASRSRSPFYMHPS